MVSLNVLFWFFVILFGVIGSMRGWAKEILVTFAVILALFFLTLLERFVPFIRDSLTGEPLFWLRTGILSALVFFGYQSPNIPRLAATNRFARERLQDTLLGLFLGAANGFLFFGTIWFYLDEAKYPASIITAPVPGSPSALAIEQLMSILPPHWLGTPAIYFAVAIAFAFVLVVFI